MKIIRMTAIFLVTAVFSAAGAETIPFPSALDEAAVVQERLDDVLDNPLILGNGDIIRVFPAWPKEKDARFENLGAQGGFLVSAEQEDGKESW